MGNIDIGLRVDTAGYRQAAAGLRVLADRGLNNATRRGLRTVAKPLGEDMVAGGAAEMPHRGGLSARVAGSSVGLRVGFAGSNPSVEIILGKRQGYHLAAMDAGDLRHPVFQHHLLAKGQHGPQVRTPWVLQHVPARAFTTPFLNGAPKVRRAVVREVQRAVDEAMGA